MNTHDKYELPPLPTTGGLQEAIKRGPEDVGRLMQSYARAAIEADRQRRVEPIAWVKPDTVENQFINMRPRRVWWECNEGIGMAIYTVPQPAEPVVWPENPPQRKGQSPVLFDDGYDEGWAKCLEACKAAVQHAQPVEPHPPHRDCMCAECAPSFEDYPTEPVKVPSDDDWKTLALWLDRRRGYPTVMISGEVAGDIADLLARYGKPEQPLYAGPVNNK